MLSFNLEDYRQAHEACLKRFSKNILITASINSLRELYISGQDEYLKGSRCVLMTHNALGIRIIAANIFAMMLKTVLEDRAWPLLNDLITCRITGINPDRDQINAFLKKCEKNHNQYALDEPALEQWCKIFNIPFSLNVDLNALYYTNQEKEIS